MDPLSVAASVVGLLGAGAKISSSLLSLISSIQDAPGLARSALQEITDITAALSHLQVYITGATQTRMQRGSLILLEHVLVTLTGCVATYSDLQRVLDRLNVGGELAVWDKLKWVRARGRVTVIVGRLQNCKASMTLMLEILQCTSQREAEESNRNLCSMLELLLKSNEDLAKRIKTLERDCSVLLDSRDDIPIIRASSFLDHSFPHEETIRQRFAFDQDLQASRVYNRSAARQSMSSYTSTALYSTALSLFSKLSLSQVSNISWYALPVVATDLSNSPLYVFGEQGTINTPSLCELEVPLSPPAGQASRRDRTHSSKQRRLLGRFAMTLERRRTMASTLSPILEAHAE